jgi:threonine synthase
MRHMVYPNAVDDKATLEAIEHAWKRYNLLLDPHGAVAMAAAERLFNIFETSSHVVILATGHPAKEAETVLKATGQTIRIPQHLNMLQKMSDPIALIDPQLEALEGAIVSCF